MVKSLLVVGWWSGHPHVDPPRSFSTPTHGNSVKRSLEKILLTDVENRSLRST